MLVTAYGFLCRSSHINDSKLEIISCIFLPLKGVLKRVPLKGVLKRVPFIRFTVIF